MIIKYFILGMICGLIGGILFNYLDDDWKRWR